MLGVGGLERGVQGRRPVPLYVGRRAVLNWTAHEEERFQDALRQGLGWLKEAGLSWEPAGTDRMLCYARLLVSANMRINLTAITDPEGVAWKHFIDSMLGLLVVGRAPRTPAGGEGEGNPAGDAAAWLADLGAGAGFPGVVLGLAGGWNCLEVEAQAKKAAFLRELEGLLRPGKLQVWAGRAERLAREEAWRERLGVVVARALARLDVIAEYGMPLLREGGLLVAYKGPEGERELELLDAFREELGVGEATVVRRRLPHDWGERLLLVLTKRGRSDPRYPRREGVPEKRPLGGRQSGKG